MKNIKKTTWIAVGCVALAILASGMYRSAQNAGRKEEEVAVISEIRPTPSPSATPALLKNTPAPKMTEVPKHSEMPTSPAAEAVNATVPPAAPKEYQLPATGEVQRPYSDTTLVKFEPLGVWKCHLGIDFLPSENDIVFAVANGTVENIYEDPLYGTTILLDHGEGIKSYYGSLSAVSVEIGTQISAGAEIGHMGETAPSEKGVHLHFSMEKDGAPVDPFSAEG